jgi:hypothetical protein
MLVIQDCPCGVPHELQPVVAEAFQRVTAGLPETVVMTARGRSWKIPRTYIAVHGVRAWELPELADRYGFEEVPRPGS